MQYSPKSILFGAIAAMALLAAPLQAHEHKHARVFFIAPTDGSVTGQDVSLRMGAEGVKVEAAGEAVESAGHHHIIIDGGPIAAGQVIPKDASHLHFGKGQTETTLRLTPGKHTLTLQFANGHHQSYGKALSQTIHITVK